MTAHTTIRTHEQTAPPPPDSNGHADGLLPALPEDRAAVVQYGLVKFQQMCAERDQYEKEVQALKFDIAAQRVELEAMRSRLADMESRVATAVLHRDQAVADRAVYEALFVSFKAQLRAFNIPAEPLVKEAEGEGECTP